MKTLLDVLGSLDPDTVLREDGFTITAADLINSGDSDLVEPATRQGNEIYLTDEQGNIYTAADPAFTIVK